MRMHSDDDERPISRLYLVRIDLDSCGHSLHTNPVFSEVYPSDREASSDSGVYLSA